MISSRAATIASLLLVLAAAAVLKLTGIAEIPSGSTGMEETAKPVGGASPRLKPAFFLIMVLLKSMLIQRLGQHSLLLQHRFLLHVWHPPDEQRGQ